MSRRALTASLLAVALAPSALLAQANKGGPISNAGQAAKPLILPSNLSDVDRAQFQDVFGTALKLAILDQPKLDRSLTAANVDFIVADDLPAEMRSLHLTPPPGFSPATNDAITISFKQKASDRYQHLVLIQSRTFYSQQGFAKGALVIQHELFSVQRRDSNVASDDPTQEAFETYRQSIAAAEQLVAFLKQKNIAPKITADLQSLIPGEKAMQEQLRLELARRPRV